MNARTVRFAVLALFTAVLAPVPSRADINVGSNGLDGEFNPSANVEIDLRLACTAPWDASPRPASPPNSPSCIPGNGVYDAEKWAVVFHYTSVNIPSGVTVTFRNHLANPPVIWLVSGSVTITGAVYLDGVGSAPIGVPAKGGPGGFEGGVQHSGSSAPHSAGRGPGGGSAPPGDFGAGGYGTLGAGNITTTYGNPQVLPLIGGSGGAGYTYGSGGGGGGILVASNTTIHIGGLLSTHGGAACAAGSGSGGAIRLLANRVEGSGTLDARGGGVQGGCGGAAGGDGRIRVEASSPEQIQLVQSGYPPYTSGSPGPVFPGPTVPTVRVLDIATIPVPADPRASYPSPDTTITSAGPAAVRLEATSVPVDGSWIVAVRVVPVVGPDFTVNATLQSGTLAQSAWTAQITFPGGASAVQARAYRQ